MRDLNRYCRVRIGVVLLLIASGCTQVMPSAEKPRAIPSVAPKMQEFVEKGEISGVVTLVATKDRIIHLNAVGKSDLASGRPMQTDDIFWIASMTKPIAAACIGILKDEGKLSFDDPLARHLPEFETITINNGTTPPRPITLRDVMTHTSGLGELNRREPHWTLAQTSQEVARTQLRFEPGTRWGYSTAGIDVLGRVVEVASGQPFDQFMQKRIFDPLGMKNTSYWIEPAKLSRWGKPYRWNEQARQLENTTISYLHGTEVTDRQRPPLGGAGLFSTAEDMCRFYQMMLNNGQLNGKRILKPETVAEMTRKQTGNLTARPGMPWGLGFCVVEDPSAFEANSMLSPGSFGHGGAFSTQSWADPTKDRIWIVMFNRQGRGHPDNTDVRIAFQQAVMTALQLDVGAFRSFSRYSWRGVCRSRQRRLQPTRCRSGLIPDQASNHSGNRNVNGPSPPRPPPHAAFPENSIARSIFSLVCPTICPASTTSRPNSSIPWLCRSR